MHFFSPNRAVASVMQSACSAEHEGAIAMHAQHYDTMQARASNLRKFNFSITFELVNQFVSYPFWP